MLVYKQLTESPTRKCRPETLLRLLLSTSYPQSILTELTFDITKMHRAEEPEVLEELAINMREVEKKFDMNDFIRCIEIRRDKAMVEIVIKRLDFDPTAKNIIDRTETHHDLAVSTIDLMEPNAELQDIEQLAAKLLEVFHRSQVKGRRGQADVANTVWKQKLKVYDRSKTLREQKTEERVHDFKGAIDVLITSLRKNRFHIVLTQETILLLDQKSRLWGTKKD